MTRTIMDLLARHARPIALPAFAAATLLSGGPAPGYPLDGEPESGIRRLTGYALAQQQPTGAKLATGALLGVADIRLGLLDHKQLEFDAAPPDPDLSAALSQIFRNRDPSYALVVVDFSNPDQPRWGGLRPDTRQNVGSVGKVLCMLALFDTLARAFPDPADRERVLRETMVRAGDWVLGDEHQVPRFDATAGVNRFARLAPSDEFRLSEWIDHAISASANGAGAVIWREAMLLSRFGTDYPLSWEASEAFFAGTPKTELSALAQSVMTRPLQLAGLNTDSLRQGSFWTGVSKRKVPGGSSFATPRELARFLFRLEQGRLVDAWSSLQMKKYMYITKRRYRYVYAPELANAATFFKSGSLYSCKPEEGFRCGKYMGNARNFMNSIVTVEYPAGSATNRYIVSLLSNVLKFNSAWDHSRLGAAVHQVVLTRRAAEVREGASARELEEVGKSD